MLVLEEKKDMAFSERLTNVVGSLNDNSNQEYDNEILKKQNIISLKTINNLKMTIKLRYINWRTMKPIN